MTDIFVRQAILADTHAITDIYCSTVEGHVFTRRNLDGTRTPIPYEELSLFERFMNGGPWMSVETCAVWLAHLLRHEDEIPLVAEMNGIVLGEAEVTIGNEPSPYGRHLHITSLKAHAETQEHGLEEALINYIKEMAQVMGIRHIFISPSDDTTFFTENGFAPLIARRLVIVPAKEGRVFYKATDLTDFHPSRTDKWFMPFGRYQDSRREWDEILPNFWNGVPELVEPEVAYFNIELSGQRGIYHIRQERYNPQRGYVRLWTERQLSSHMVSAIRDRAARLGYTELALFVDDTALALVEPEALDIRDAQILLAWRQD